MARMTCAFENVSPGGANPKPPLRWAVAPRLLVMMMRQWRKSATRPEGSDRRPSSKTCRNKSQMPDQDFSNSSSKITENGCLRTRAMSEPVSPGDPSPMILGIESGVWNSLMSRRIMRSSSPNRKLAVVLASSVLPVPVGPAKRKMPTGLAGSFRPAFSMAMRSTIADTASSCPMTRAPKKSRVCARSSFSLASRMETGRPVRRESVSVMSDGVTPAVFSLPALRIASFRSEMAEPGKLPCER